MHFLGPGETCHYIAKELLHYKKLTVLTNNLYVANILAFGEGIRLTITGGQLAPNKACFASEKLHLVISDLALTKAFIAPAGADIQAGYTVGNRQEVFLFQEIVAHSRETILVLDALKFGSISFVKLGDLNLCKTVVTEQDIPKEYTEIYSKYSIAWHTAGNC